MNKRKIIISIISICCLIAIIIILFAGGNEKKANVNILDEVCFSFNPETKTIEGYDSICGTNVGIPETINEITVENIGTRAFSSKNIENLLLPNTIKTIGIGAFENNSITDLIIPNSVKNIKPMAFINNKINSLLIGSGVNSIGLEAFNNNQLPDKEAFIYYRDETGENKTILIGYGGKEKDIVKIPSQIKIIYLNALSDNNINNIILNDGLKRIEPDAFSGNNIKEIIIPNTVDIINDSLNYFLDKIIIKGKKSINEFSYYNENINEKIIKYE